MQFTKMFAIGLLAALSSVSLAQAVTTATPPEIQVPPDQTLILTLSATGDQIYTCQAKSDQPGQYEWQLKAPEALLYDEQGQEVGHHYGGPSWEMADGSKVMGQLKSKVDAPEASAIPWLLLQVKSHEGEGVLSAANWIQRVDTVGGKAPQTGCDAAHANQEFRVGYSAIYYFYGDRSVGRSS